MVAAAILRAVPPLGLGVFVRDAIEPVMWDFVAVNAWRSDVREQARIARERGADVWVYGTPERFRPDTWREGLARLLAVARDVGAVGIIADAEGAWPEAPANVRDAEAEALGAALADASSDVRAAFTSYPSWPALGALARGARGNVAAIVQIYGRSAFSTEAFAAWLAQWRGVFGSGRVGIAAAGFVPDERPSMGTPEGFADYLGKLPRAPSVTVWDASGPMPAFMVDAWNAYPRPSIVERSGALVLAPGVLVLLAVVAVVGAALYMGK